MWIVSQVEERGRPALVAPSTRGNSPPQKVSGCSDANLAAAGLDESPVFVQLLAFPCQNRREIPSLYVLRYVAPASGQDGWHDVDELGYLRDVDS